MIAKYRKEKGYSQEQLAEILDISTRQLQRIETKESDTKLSTLRKIINVLQISDSDIVKIIKEPYPRSKNILEKKYERR